MMCMQVLDIEHVAAGPRVLLVLALAGRGWASFKYALVLEQGSPSGAASEEVVSAPA